MNQFDIILKNAKVWTGKHFLEKLQDVGIKDGIIAKIGIIEKTADYVFDVKGNIVSPGLIDMHMHMMGCSEELYEVPIEASCFPNGVTTAADAAVVTPFGR